jgi:predicted dehydrogenase
MNKLKVGLIGAGGITDVHVPAWLALGAKVTVFSATGAERLAQRYGLTVADSLEDAFDAADIVDICTPTTSHSAIAGWMPTDRAWFTDPDLAGGGALVDHVVHCAELIDDLLGLPAETVRAVSNRILHGAAGLRVETAGLVNITYRAASSRRSTARGASRPANRTGAGSPCR